MTRIPKTWLGEEIKGSLEKVLSSDKSQPITPVTQQTPLVANANINPIDYIQIPDTNTVIERYQSQSNNKLNWKDTHFRLADNSLFMPTPYLMTKHLVNVVNAQGGIANLYDAQGKVIPANEVQEIYQYLTKDGHGGGVWTWLDAKFEKTTASFQKGFDLETNHRLILIGSDKELHTDISQLVNPVEEDCFVDLDFNAQGMPKKKSANQNYSQGQNIYFYQPRESRVARFNAYSGRARLDCDRNPDYADAGLGVLACAEGTQQKI
ncbi:MAG: hypothetical protein AABW41_05005 [Nanoarchaeota archaeon]